MTHHAEPAPASSPITPSQAAPWLPLGSGVRVVATHPCGLYVLDKPEGILSHPNKRSEEARSLLNASYSLQQECFSNFQPEAAPHLPKALYLLHRLDSATSGLLLLADSQALAQSVRRAFAEGGVRKTYLALCANFGGAKSGVCGRWTERLQRQRAGAGNSPIHVRAGSGASACTEYLCKQVDPHLHALALFELSPISGRTHQLRVHCAEHAFPIIGDGKYGDFRLNRELARLSGEKRLFLHAARLSLRFTFNARTVSMDLRAATPPAFEAMLKSTSQLAAAFQAAGNRAAVAKPRHTDKAGTQKNARAAASNRASSKSANFKPASPKSRQGNAHGKTGNGGRSSKSTAPGSKRRKG